MARSIGLSSAHIAILEKDDETGVVYLPPMKLQRSIKAKMTPKTSSEKQWSDDSVEEIIQSFDGIDVEFELNQLTLEERALLQGSEYKDGRLTESKNDKPPTVALGFKSQQSNGKYRFVWLFKGQFAMTSDEFETAKDKQSSKTPTLKGEFYAREHDGKTRTFEDETDSTSALHTSWFTIETLTGSTTTPAE